jgi:hypothetical protein
LGIKEEETRLILHEHDDDDYDNYVFVVGTGLFMSTMQLKYPADMMKSKLINSL